MFQKSGIYLHLPCQIRLALLAEGIPFGQHFRPVHHLGVLGHQAQFFLAFQLLCPVGMPSIVELSLILVPPLFWHLDGRMNRTRRVVHKERGIPQPFPVVQPLDGLIRHPLGNMELRSIGIGFRGVNGCGVFVQQRMKLIGFTPQKSPEIFKPPDTRGPAFKGTGRRGFFHGGIVPFAECGRGISVVG